MPSCLLAPRVSVRTRQKIMFGVLAQRGPGLLAVHDVVVARRSAPAEVFSGREVGARAGFRNSPGTTSRSPFEDARQPVALLRPALPTALIAPARACSRRRARCAARGQRAFVLEDELLHRRPARAAVLLGPVVARASRARRGWHAIPPCRPPARILPLRTLSDSRAGSLSARKARTSPRKASSSGVKFRSIALLSKKISFPRFRTGRPAPMPPAMHIVTTAYLAPRRLPSISTWPARRAPVMPKGGRWRSRRR